MLRLTHPQETRKLTREGRIANTEVVARYGFMFYGYRQNAVWWCVRGPKSRLPAAALQPAKRFLAC